MRKKRETNKKRISDIFDLGDQNTQILKSIQIKYSRDYLQFFGSLSELYGRSPQGREIEGIVLDIRRVISIIEDIREDKKITKEDSDLLYSLIDKIEERKSDYLSKAKDIKAVQDRLDKVISDLGISPSDLNMTREIAQKGIKQISRSRGEGALPFLRRTMPRSFALGSQLMRGLTAATLGPFTPLAQMGMGLTKDVLGLGKGLTQKLGEYGERRLGSQLRPMAARLPYSEFEDLFRRRAELPKITGFKGVSTRKAISKEKQVEPLKHFFDKEAYKAKWTKEILSYMKEVANIGKRGFWGGLLDKLGISGLVGKFGLLGAALLPLIGKVGLFAGLAAALGFSIIELNRLGKVAKELKEEREEAGKVGKRLERARGKLELQVAERGLGVVAKELEITPQELIRELALNKRIAQEAAREGFKAKEPIVASVPGVGFLGRKLAGYELPEVQPLPEIIKEYENLFRKDLGELSRIEMEKIQLPKTTPEMDELLDSIVGLKDTMDNLSRKVDASEFGSARNVPIGNPYDSGDLLLRELANGDLGMEGSG